ncbi:MAG: hypothetical protein HPY44_19250 [Armatimonadetes bacterium]|nr:hypothetical protein [Armatimonadota bacterium]
MIPLLLITIISLLIPGSVTAQALGPCEPVTGCYIGAYIEMDPVARDDIATFERVTGKKHATYFRYVGYGQPFPFEWANRLKRAGATPHIAWEPNEGLDKVQDDEYLRGWVQACANFGEPVFIRFASEMNGDWEAWSGDPDLYVKKWRMVYEAFYRGAPNAILIWCPFATPKSTIPLYYPGDEYVDWVGVNVYSVVYHSGDVTKRAVDNAVQHLEFIYNLYADRKPIAIGEYAATHYCQAAASATVDFAIREMRRMYESIQTRFPRVRMINWFSVDAVREELAHNDYSLTTDEQVLAAYRALVSSPHFLSKVDGGIAPGPSVVLPGTAEAPVAFAPSQPFPPLIGPSEPLPGGPPTPGASMPAKPTSVPLAFSGGANPPRNGAAIVVKGGEPGALRGRVTVEAILDPNLQPDRVTFEMDGRFRATSTTPAWFFPLNADALSPGEHVIRVTVRDMSGGVIAQTEAAVIVPEK